MTTRHDQLRTLGGCKAANAKGPALVFTGQVGNQALCKGRFGRGLVCLRHRGVFVRGRLRTHSLI